MAHSTTYSREQLDTLARRLREPRRFIQTLLGPRQVGKTTLARQAMASFSGAVRMASADTAIPEDTVWIEAQWRAARASSGDSQSLLVLDEVQKIPRWSSVVKAMWDEDTGSGRKMKVLLLGSSPMLMQAGLTESLAGRFEIIRVPHWSFREMKEAFGYSVDEYLYFGGYPGAAGLIGEEARWRAYVNDSLIETTVSRDILLMTRVDKPALLRRLFALACEYSGQVLSFQKMIGQLQDVGNTTTLAHYLDLLAGAGFVIGLQKYSGQAVRQRGSSPKLQVLNTALMSATQPLSFSDARARHEYWGRVVESAVGAHLLNQLAGTPWQVMYWKEGAYEVDFVVTDGDKLFAIEVKSQHVGALSGLAAFRQHYANAVPMVVGPGGIAVDDFLGQNVLGFLS